MEGNLLKEISYLTRLIEQHNNGRTENHNSFDKQNYKKFNYSSIPGYTMESSRNDVKPVLAQGRVHLNPNFKPKIPGIHVNPRIGTTRPTTATMRSSVYVNPKMMENFSAPNNEKNTTDINILRKNTLQNNIVQKKIEPSVYVNPKLMKELSLSVKEKSKELKSVDSKISQPDNRLILQSRTKIVKSNSSPNLPIKKIYNSNLVSLSRRKLIRIRRSSKTGSIMSPTNFGKVKRLSNSNIRKTKVSTKYKLVMERVDRSSTIGPVSRSIKNREGGLSKYKIDRTHLQKVKKRLSVGRNNSNLVNKKVSGSSTGLVRIGGILYKSSRNQLVRSSGDQQILKKKRCIINVKGDRFVMASNGKKLRRLNTTANRSGTTKSSSLVSKVHIGGMTFVEKSPNVLVRADTKNNISTKAKQRSIQILRNKMRKNNQPCLIFQKFGFCSGQVKGTCPKLHDKKQVALCRNFLQGKCLLDNCPMSHSVCPEKMPTCKYFLEGCCIRDHCPYLHVKVSSNTPICTQFLRGYCAEANKCKQRHVFVCPEYERLRSCAKGKYCPYPHKQSPTDCRKSIKVIENRRLAASRKKMSKLETVIATPSSSSSSASLSSSHTEDRRRYYDEAGGSKKELEKKRKTILGSIEIIKSVRLAEVHGEDTQLCKIMKDEDINEKTLVVENHENNDRFDEEDSCPKRTPLGPLPAYIPID